ncbi:MAG: MFS transporter [Clostridiales bacterium]
MRNIILLGLVSFFADLSTEMVYPLIPLYLTAVLGATPALVGVIEGIAESVASLLKVFSGYFTDKYHHKKAVAFLGYGTGLIYKIVLLFAGSWAGVLSARVIDRVGKGIRTAPRDVIVSESAGKNHLGGAFGIHKAMDMAGSGFGVLLAYLILANAGGNIDYKKIFIISMVPIILGLVALLFVKESPKKTRPLKIKEPFWQRFHELDRNLKLYLAVAFIFTLGNSSNTFLLLRAKDLGFSDMNVVLLYLLYTMAAAILAIPFGRISDKIGRKTLLVLGYFAFTGVYLGFALVTDAKALVLIFALYGIYTAMTAGVERALIADIAPKDLKGTMLGLHGTVVGVALLPASIIAGALWTGFGVMVPFIFGAALSFVAGVILLFFLKTKPLHE